MAPLIVPIVDISGFAEGSSQRRADIAALVDEAYCTVGFLQVMGHGVSPALVEEMFAVNTEYFDQPLAAKLEHVMPPAWNRGYSPPGAEALSYSAGVETPPDVFQAFNAGAQIHTTDPATRPERHQTLYRTNIWPEMPARMGEVWQEYIDAVSTLAQHMLEILSVAQGLDPDYFPSRADQAPDVVRALDYRSFGDAPMLDGQMRLGAHSDYGMCTMLSADAVPGLQLLDPSGVWHDVTPLPGAYLVNVGDMLAVWTNDRYRSTVHRVVPAARGAPMTRRSVAYFHEANPDAVIEPVPGCVDSEHPQRYAPGTAGDHLLAKLSSARDMAVAEAVQTTGDRADALTEE